VAGLDEICQGGLLARRAYLIRGGPGSGKTILGMHFLSCGAVKGERTLFISLGEPESELRQNAGVLGFDLSGVHMLDLSPSSEFFTDLRSYDIFSPAEVERDPVAQKISKTVRELRPDRVFVDGMRQFQYLTPDAFHFRRQVSSFLRLLMEQGATVLFTSESELPDEDLQFICDGALQLNSTPDSRSVYVIKFRGSDFRSGAHSLRLTSSGMEVFPRLLPEQHTRDFQPEPIPSGIAEIDQMLEGGLERGTISLVTGPSGVGKTTLGLHFVKEAARRGERSVVYLFEELEQTMLRRCEATNIPVQEMVAKGTFCVTQIEPLQFTADQFARMVRQEVEKKKARVVMIDSIAGYRLSLRGQDLVTHLHGLAKYLQNMGVAVLLINEVEAITGDFRVSEVGVSYVADNIVFLRYIEIRGEICKALGVLKKRLSDHDKVMREIKITGAGIVVGERLTKLRGVLRGTPEWVQTAPHE
jgi:circadian clock protein KaiC